MSRLTLLSAAVVCAFAGAAVAEDKVKSGLDLGASPGAFNVRDITGPNAGKTLCYR